MAAYDLIASPLSRSGFEPFGDVIEIEGSRHFTINQGWAERYHDLAQIEVTAADGRPLLSIFRASPRALPMRVRSVERHVLASQAFVPLSPARFLIVVAPAGTAPAPEDLRAFVTDGLQGVNYRPGVWHHALLALDQVSDFVVVDRGAAEEDCEEITFEADEITLHL